MNRIIQRILATVLIFTVSTMTVMAAVPIQYNPNTVVPTGIDSSTGNATVPFVDHTTGSVYTTTANASGVTAPTTASGVPYVVTESIKASYRASASDVSPVASATDATILCGSATKTIRVNRVAITADATSAGVIDFYLFKRTTANTGGAASAVSVGQMDSNDPAATATVAKYTANPATLGTGVLIASDHYALPAAASTGIPVFIWSEDFGTRNNETLVLRGVAQCLAVNLNAQAIPAGMNMYVNYGWTEE